MFVYIFSDIITAEEYAQIATALDIEIRGDPLKISSLCEELKIEESEHAIADIPGWQKFLQIFLLWERSKEYKNCSKKELSVILSNLGYKKIALEFFPKFMICLL